MRTDKWIRGLLFVSALLFAGIALYSLARYETRLADMKSLVIYFFLPLALAVFQLVLIRLSRPNRVLAFALELAIVFGAYGSEVYLQFFDHVSGPADRPDLPALVADMEGILKSGVKHYPVPFIRPELVPEREGERHSIYSLDGQEFLPLAGISHVQTVFCAEARSTFLTYLSDRYGFNNADAVWDNAVTDIATVGDSFAHGVCVEPEEHMVGLIRNRFPATINLGRLGTGPLLQLALIREYLPSVKPKTVIWFLEEANDIRGDLFDERNITVLKNYLGETYSQNLPARQPDIDSLLKETYDRKLETSLAQTKSMLAGETGQKLDFAALKNNLIRVAKLTNTRGLLGLGVDRKQDAVIDTLYRTYGKILSDAQQVVQSWGGNLYLVLLQSEYKYQGWKSGITHADQRRRILAAVEGAGVRLIDLGPVFDAHPNPLSLFQGHYTPEGYRMAGEAVLDYLEKEGVRPSP